MNCGQNSYKKLNWCNPCILQMGKLGPSAEGLGPGPRDRMPGHYCPSTQGPPFRGPTSYSPFNLRHNQPCQRLPPVAPRREWEGYSALYWGGEQWGVVKELSPSSLALSPPPFPPPKPPSMGTPQNQVPFHTPTAPPMAPYSRLPSLSWPGWGLSPPRPCPRPVYTEVTPPPSQ